MSTTLYDDAEVPISPPPLNMAIKRNWMGKDSNITRPLFVNAIYGLSPFLILDMTEDQVSPINEDYEALTRESYVTVEDINSFKNLMTPDIPDTAVGYMM